MVAGFKRNLNEGKVDFKENIGKYQAIYTTTQHCFRGKIKYETAGKIILGPTQGCEYDPKEGPILKLVDEEIEINKNILGVRENLTKKNLENYCKYSNNQAKQQKKPSKKKSSKKITSSHS